MDCLSVIRVTALIQFTDMPIKVKKPMLAAPLLGPKDEHTDEAILKALKKLKYPVGCTLKKDGIRALRLNSTLLSRTFKPIPNASIRQRSLKLIGGMDMELWNPDLVYDEIESIVMSQKHERSDEIHFHILDHITEHGYLARIAPVYEHFTFQSGAADVHVELPVICKNAEQLMEIFLKSEEMMGEGVCFRTLMSPYKQGRSTLKEQYLVKLCRFVREEVVIIELSEQVENTNKSNRNAVGSMDRSSNLANLVPKDTLGALVCKRANGQIIRVGTGFDDILRKKIWTEPEQYVGKTITIKYKPHGMKDLPRSPVFVGFRKDKQ